MKNTRGPLLEPAARNERRIGTSLGPYPANRFHTEPRRFLHNKRTWGKSGLADEDAGNPHHEGGRRKPSRSGPRHPHCVSNRSFGLFTPKKIAREPRAALLRICWIHRKAAGGGHFSDLRGGNARRRAAPTFILIEIQTPLCLHGPFRRASIVGRLFEDAYGTGS